MSAASLYIHIPFCEVRCPYCHFYCFVNKDGELPKRYVRALVGEAKALCESGHLIEGIPSIYIGGGTPSALDGSALDAMCRWIADDLLPLCTPDVEITIEMNPESTVAARLRRWVNAGVNRVSLGLQSMDADILKFLGRWNTPESNRRALDLVCSEVANVSADLIVGTPDSSWESTRSTLEQFTEYPIRHVSAYLLEIHRETRFGRDVRARRWQPQPDEDQSEIYLQSGRWLAERGFAAYELSNYAHAGFESRHNARYWRREPYLGLGASSHSFRGEMRWWNVSDAAEYCERVELGKSPSEGEECLGAEEQRSERLLLGLRTAEGVPLTLCANSEKILAAWAAEGLVQLDSKRVRLTPGGWLVMDQLVSQLLRLQGFAAGQA